MELDTVTRSLAAISLFEGLDVDQIQQITKLGVNKRFRRGEALIEQSSLGNEFFVLLAGRVSIKITGPNQEAVEVASLKDGDVIGETILLGKIRRVATVEAKDDVICMAWRSDSLLSFFEKNPECGYRFMKNMARVLSEKISNSNMVVRNMQNQ